MIIKLIKKPWYLVLWIMVFGYIYCSAQVEDSSSQEDFLALQRQENNDQLKPQDSSNILDNLQQTTLQGQSDNIQESSQWNILQLQLQSDSLRAIMPGVPVVIFNDTVFYIFSNLGPLNLNDRAENITSKVEMLVTEEVFDPSKLTVVESELSHDVMHDSLIICSITDRDSFLLNSNRGLVANLYLQAIKQSVENYKSQNGLLIEIKRIGLLFLIIILLFFGIKYLDRYLEKVNNFVLKKSEPYIQGMEFRNYEFLSKEREEHIVRWFLNLVKWTFNIVIIYLSLPILFNIFPSTEGIAVTLFGYFINPLELFFFAFVEHIPQIITIAVIIFLARYFVRFLRFLSKEVASGKLQLPGFYPDWAVPTYNLLKVFIYAFAFIMIFPYLPGSHSPIFRGVSVFFGLLISLGSSSAIGNIIAGLVIIYMRAFKIGDRVKIGDTTGDVIEKSMLVTRLRTIKNEDITIPNIAILNGSTINYSSSAQSLGLVINSTVTIGYDVPWRKVHELLIGAALKTDHISKHPQPFVLQTSLDDYYVSYQINAYTKEPKKSASIYSQLHSNIQDLFNESGVEILSPHYRASRDGNMTTIPESYLPSDYNPPSFKVDIKKDS